jgi:hypothetical protein
VFKLGKLLKKVRRGVLDVNKTGSDSYSKKSYLKNTNLIAPSNDKLDLKRTSYHKPFK